QRRRTLLIACGIIALVLLAGLSVSLWQMRRGQKGETGGQTSGGQTTRRAGGGGRKAKKTQGDPGAKGLAPGGRPKGPGGAFAALRSMTAEVVERKFAQGTALTEDDRAFLRGVIAQFDAFAAIKGEDADSRAVRAEGRFRVGTMRDRLGELREAEQDYDQALSIQKQLAADFPGRPEFRQALAWSHNNRGILLRDAGRLREAQQDVDRALSLRKQLAADF